LVTARAAGPDGGREVHRRDEQQVQRERHEHHAADAARELGTLDENVADRFPHLTWAGWVVKPTFSTPAAFSWSVTVMMSCAVTVASIRRYTDLSSRVARACFTRSPIASMPTSSSPNCSRCVCPNVAGIVTHTGCASTVRDWRDC